MRNLITFIVLPIVKVLSPLVAIAAMLILFCVSAKAQNITKCPVTEGLYKYKSLTHQYDSVTKVYTKIYETELGFVSLIMQDVCKESYELHRYGHTIPTNLKHNVVVKWRNRYKRFTHTQILRSTKQL